ncbi:MAG TPA: lytic transglycosylase domain-containing protein [Candidatus Krumholzibacteria bacterium]|nr:lytic transglycosylase domain-containing protein [Candidatus Krumholzibacteria bacterium]
MHRSSLYAVFAVMLAAAGLIGVPAHASKTTSALPPGNPDADILNRARLLASYGEPHLALAALREHGFMQDATTARVSASLLTTLGQPARAESLLALGPRATDGKEQFQSQLVRARLLLDAGQVPAALATIGTMDSTMTSPYAAYRDLIAARALSLSGDKAQAARLLERARPVAPAAIRAEIDEARVAVYRALDNPRAALAAAEDATSEGDAASARQLLRTRFEIASDIGDVAQESEAARTLFTTARRSREAQACALALAADADRADTALLVLCASVLQANGERDALRGMLRKLDARTLTPDQSEAERLLWAEYHFMGGDFSRAIALSRPTYTDPDLRRRSMLLMARSYKRVGRNVDAAATYEGFAGAFPNDNLAAEALYTAASLYEQLKRDTDRDRVLDQLRHAYPSTFHGWAASMARARDLDASGDHDDAAAIFDQWLVRSRRTDEAALFYSSRLHLHAGDLTGSDALLTELRAVNPYSFYACPDLLAPAMANGDARGAQPVSLRAFMTEAAQRRDTAFRRVRAEVEADNPDRAASAEAAASIERARFFLAVGFRDWAESELDVARRLSAADPVQSLELARIFDDSAMPWRSVRLYERSRAGIPWSKRKDSEDDFRYLTHPVPYPVQVVGASGREGIAPYVLYGMMREESCFDSDVVSRAGAVGLMQLMPDTARRIAKHVDLDEQAGDRLGDPVVNVSIGSWYAADLLRAGKGSVVWMLAAYNAGPAAANQWIRPGADGDTAIEAVESIDYKETRGYVKRVVESANVYHALYFDGASASNMPR